MGKLPCNALAFVWALAQTDYQALATHLCRLFFHVSVWLDGPWRRHSLKGRQHHEDAMAAKTKRPNKRAFWTLPFGTTWQSIFLCKAARRPTKKNRKTQKVKAFSYGHTIGRNETEGFFFFSNNFNLRGCAWSCGDWWHETCPQLHTRKGHFAAC